VNLIESKNRINCTPHFFIILSIPLLVFISIILGYLKIISLNIEIHTLIVIGFIFFIFFLFVQHNANFAVCKIKGSYETMENNLKIALENNALSIMDKTKSTLNIRVFIDEYYKNIRNDNFANIASSIFPMLGILGTFIAIALSMPNFTVSDINALDKEITILLAGVGTAFYASIYGIFLSIWWTYFEKRGLSKIDNYIYGLEQTYKNHIWQESELIKHQHMQTQLKDQEIINTLKETFSMEFVKDLNEQYMKNFKIVVDNTSKIFTTLTEDMDNASRNLKNTLEIIHSREESVNAVDTISQNIEAFNSNAKNIEKTINKFDNSLDRTFVKIDSEIGEIVGKLGEFAVIISKQNREIQESIKLQNRKREIKNLIDDENRVI